VRRIDRAGLDLHTTRFFEAHGTGTQVGDVLEATAMGSVFGAVRSPADALSDPSEHGPILPPPPPPPPPPLPSTLRMRTAFLSSWHTRLRLDGAHSCGGLSSRPALSLSFVTTLPRDWLRPCARLHLPAQSSASSSLAREPSLATWAASWWHTIQCIVLPWRMPRSTCVLWDASGR